MKDNKRAYHFSSSVCSVNEYNSIIIEDRFKTAQAGIKLFRVFCDGFARNKEIIHVFSKRPTTRVKSGRIILPAKDENDQSIRYHYCRLINIPFVGLIYSFFASLCWYLSPSRCSSKDIVFVDPLNVSIGYGTLLACKIRRIKCVMILTDLPRYYCYNGNGSMSTQQKLSEKLSKKADAYVFVTKQMNDVINPKNKPYIVMEGFVDVKMQDLNVLLTEKYKPFVCMYTGGIDKAYGLDMLIEGFLSANIPNSELHIYGSGKYVPEIREAAKEDCRIKYFGSKDNQEVVVAQMKATILINPRYTSAEYTKYSFPSKNLEYAASGTPTLTTRLPGMPEEYNEHVIILDDETPSGLSKILKILSEKPRYELYEFGQETKKWMIKNKNSEIQIKRIIDFTNRL